MEFSLNIWQQIFKEKKSKGQRHSEQVALGESPFMLPVSFTITLLRMRRYIPQPKST